MQEETPERRKKNAGKEAVDPIEMILLEQDLADLKKERGIQENVTWRTRLGRRLARRAAGPRLVNRKTYIRLALCCGWFCGAHRFYTGQKLLGTLYLLFCWSGIPAAMTLIDLMIVIPIQPDEQGRVLL
ncbi:MAG: NINE protein [Provencibacterium sp.]|jgi:TM2 domain-containing membrane protein YozV|nr:NINE protein [Provencibacterium sp.]